MAEGWWLGAGVLGVAVIGAAGLVLFGGPRALDAAPFAGCYRGGDTMVRLAPDGSFASTEGQWRFRILSGTVEQLEIADAAIRVDGARLRFERAGAVINTPIHREEGFDLGPLHFAKVPCDGGPRFAARTGEQAA